MYLLSQITVQLCVKNNATELKPYSQSAEEMLKIIYFNNKTKKIIRVGDQSLLSNLNTSSLSSPSPTTMSF